MGCSPERILAMSRGFQEARVLQTAVELDLFTLLVPTPLSAEDAARRVGAHLRPLRAMLDALCALGLMRKEEGRYQTPPDVAPLLGSDGPRSVLPMVLHRASMWRSWSDLTAIVRETGTPRREPVTRRGENELRAFIGAMHVVGRPVADAIAAAVAPGEARAMLDVGGGPGTYTMAFLRASPQLRATLFDLPPVIEMARANLEQEGLLARVTLAPGSFQSDPLPGGHDLALLSAIVHSYSLEENTELLRKVFAALEPGGRVVIRDHVMADDRISPPAGALFAINMLVATEGGGTYTYGELKGALDAAGFSRVNLLQAGERMDGIVEAFRP